VTTDVDRFRATVSSCDPGRVVEAMRLVRGPPFGGLRQADWAVFDGTQALVERLVVGTALRGADDLVALGRGDEAEWVVRRALAVNPYDERLYRGLLRATAAQGNRVALRSTMAQLLTLAGEAAGERRAGRRGRGASASSCLHPETTDLYRELLGGGPAV
jgi:DNA-binding SARP family transcriptional activator